MKIQKKKRMKKRGESNKIIYVSLRILELKRELIKKRGGKEVIMYRLYFLSATEKRNEKWYKK